MKDNTYSPMTANEAAGDDAKAYRPTPAEIHEAVKEAGEYRCFNCEQPAGAKHEARCELSGDVGPGNGVAGGGAPDDPLYTAEKVELASAGDAPWSVRVPAAIATAKGLIDPVYDSNVWSAKNGQQVLTATEVALAEALWTAQQYYDPTLTPPELIAFTEKVESLEGAS